MKIPDAKRKKLDDKAVKVKFLGYDQTSKGYRLADIKTNKVVISREVEFLNGRCVEVDLESCKEVKVENSESESDADEEETESIDESDYDTKGEADA